jgi:hypothetical protein
MHAPKSEIDEQVISMVIDMLGHARMVPGMYVYSIGFASVENFLGGIQSGLSTAFKEVPIRGCRDAAKLARGYSKFMCSMEEFEAAVRQRHSDEGAVIDELFAIEIDAWIRLREVVRSRSTA